MGAGKKRDQTFGCLLLTCCVRCLRFWGGACDGGTQAQAPSVSRSWKCLPRGWDGGWSTPVHLVISASVIVSIRCSVMGKPLCLVRGPFKFRPLLVYCVPLCLAATCSCPRRCIAVAVFFLFVNISRLFPFFSAQAGGKPRPHCGLWLSVCVFVTIIIRTYIFTFIVDLLCWVSPPVPSPFRVF